YQDVTGYLSGAGVTVQLDPTGLPERTAVSFRIRVANSVGTSDFSNEASSSSALLAPTLQGAQQVSTGVRLTWVPRSDVTALLVERSDLQNPSASAVTGSANPGQTAFVDTTLVEGGYYYYRLHWVDGALQGYPSYSNPIPTSLLAPSDLVAVGGVERVDLSWVNHSQTATEVDVFRADGLNDFYFGQLVAHLPPTPHRDPLQRSGSDRDLHLPGGGPFLGGGEQRGARRLCRHRPARERPELVHRVRRSACRQSRGAGLDGALPVLGAGPHPPALGRS